MYEILLALADKFEADTACCGAWQGNEENYIVRNIWRRFKEDEVCYNGGSALGNVIEQSGTLWNKLLKRELIGCIRFNEKIRYAEDTLFLSEYLLKANCVAVTKTPLYYYRINRLGNVVSGGLNSRHLDYLYATALIFDILRENGSVDVGVERVVDVGIRVAALMNKTNKQKCYMDAIRQLAKKAMPYRTELIKNNRSVKQYFKKFILTQMSYGNCLFVYCSKIVNRIK